MANRKQAVSIALYAAISVAVIIIAVAIFSHAFTPTPDPTPPLVPPQSVTVPILMYHQFDETTAIDFERHMQLLSDNGYTPVPLDALSHYVRDAIALPAKPIVITMDDGYYSNYQYAYPVLQKFNYPATIFIIGCSFGHMEFYKDTQHRLTPHFGAAEAKEMLASNLVSLQSHTYDMHQWAPFETTLPVRENIKPWEHESQEDYIAALTADFQKEQAVLKQIGVNTITAVAFPLGETTALTNEVLANLGVSITLTTDPTRVNTLTLGKPESLLNLGRKGIDRSVTDDELLAYLANGTQG